MSLNTHANHSYWELKSYFKTFDVIVIGSGIVGLSTAISLKQKHKKARVLVLEKGLMPDGASSKNAGFACFGSAGELLADLDKTPQKTVVETVKMRWDGLQILRKRFGDKNIAYQGLGGFEMFDSRKNYAHCQENIPRLNTLIKETLGLKKCFSVDLDKIKLFKKTEGVIVNKYEGQLDTALMMHHLLFMARQKGVVILNNIHVTAINSTETGVELKSSFGTFKGSKVVVATNGFASKLLNLPDVEPARAQVLITKPIKDLRIKGTFHYDEGYYYFRNIDKRILFGGGRNLDFKTENTDIQGINKKIQNRLDILLKEMILPGIPFEIEQRWSGIMGVGSEKKPIIKTVQPNVLAAVRMGGMGIAIGSLVGELAAKEIMQ